MTQNDNAKELVSRGLGRAQVRAGGSWAVQRMSVGQSWRCLGGGDTRLRRLGQPRGEGQDKCDSGREGGVCSCQTWWRGMFSAGP